MEDQTCLFLNTIQVPKYVELIYLIYYALKPPFSDIATVLAFLMMRSQISEHQAFLRSNPRKKGDL